MKKKIEKPEIEFVEFDAEDVITTSGGGGKTLMRGTFNQNNNNDGSAKFDESWLSGNGILQ